MRRVEGGDFSESWRILLTLLAFLVGLAGVVILPQPWAELSVLTVGVAGAALIERARQWFERRRRFQQVVDLFGREGLERPVAIVYPEFVLSPEAKGALTDIHAQAVYGKSDPDPLQQTYRIDLDVAVAANDVEAMIFANQMVGTLGQCESRIVADSNIREYLNHPSIIIGLSSNRATHVYLATTEDPLFRIVEDGSGSEFLQAVPNESFPLKEGYEYGVVVRDWRDKGCSHSWMIVAGAGATATPGAAWYAFHHWQELIQRAAGDAFVAVVRVIVGQPRSAQLVHFATRGNTFDG